MRDKPQGVATAMPEPLTLAGLGGALLSLLVHLSRRYFATAKGVVDVMLGFLALMVFLPILGACAAIIKLSSRGPVLYTQVRIGKGGKAFRMYKLRTMYVNAEAGTGPVWARKKDPRVVPACAWMRRSHVDELPQLINVLRGQMSLVGPRPERPEILRELSKEYPQISKRLEVRPGITGLAQIRNGYDTSVEDYGQKLKADLEYIAKRCWGMELSILARTLTRFHDPAAH